MPTVRISIQLPYLLVLPVGEYPTPGIGGSVWLSEVIISGSPFSEQRTEASSLFEAPDTDDAESRDRSRREEADRLLRRVNRLLRWYRVTTNHATIIELTRAQASPFSFSVEWSNANWDDGTPLQYEPTLLPVPAHGSRESFGQRVFGGLGFGTDPDVADLNLLDAEHALTVGRFREAVLLCWGAIDSTFVRSFKRLVDERLGQEWPEARDFLKGIDFGLRHKMTTGLRLLTGHSLYAEPDQFWQELSASYNLRNRIIHEGHVAHEDDAKRSIRVARRVVQIVRSQSPQ